ncbi:hypothetical protein U9M48_035678, partial [Paspalum notatum var. saurae]
KVPHFREDEQGTLWYKNRICVPNVDSIRKLILSEAHNTAYSIHLGSTKMYCDLKERFWWYGMKYAVAEYVAICDTCQRVKAHQRPTDGQTERTNQILEDMLRAYAIQYGTSWDKCLPYTEFSYNNSYQASLKKSSFEALYGKRCRTPLFWNQTGEKQVFEPDIIQDVEQQLRIVRENLREGFALKVDDHVYLKVSQMRAIRRFNMKGKLAPRYVGPFKILEKKGEVAYRLELPPNLSGVHDVFHVSQLKKCLRVLEEQVQEDLTYIEHRVKILDTSEIVTRNKRIKMCRVQWSHRTEAEATWEREDKLKAAYPALFANQPI